MDKEQAYKIGLAFKLGMIYARGKAHARKLTTDKAEWITVHPNGKENKGRPALLDSETGEVLGGMGGKFNGKHISAVPQHGKNEQMGAQMRVNAKSHKADLMNGQKIDFIKNNQTNTFSDRAKEALSKTNDFSNIDDQSVSSLPYEMLHEKVSQVSKESKELERLENQIREEKLKTQNKAETDQEHLDYNGALNALSDRQKKLDYYSRVLNQEMKKRENNKTDNANFSDKAKKFYENQLNNKQTNTNSISVNDLSNPQKVSDYNKNVTKIVNKYLKDGGGLDQGDFTNIVNSMTDDKEVKKNALRDINTSINNDYWAKYPQNISLKHYEARGFDFSVPELGIKVWTKPQDLTPEQRKGMQEYLYKAYTKDKIRRLKLGKEDIKRLSQNANTYINNTQKNKQNKAQQTNKISLSMQDAIDPAKFKEYNKNVKKEFNKLVKKNQTDKEDFEKFVENMDLDPKFKEIIFEKIEEKPKDLIKSNGERFNPYNNFWAKSPKDIDLNHEVQSYMYFLPSSQSRKMIEDMTEAEKNELKQVIFNKNNKTKLRWLQIEPDQNNKIYHTAKINSLNKYINELREIGANPSNAQNNQTSTFSNRAKEVASVLNVPDASKWNNKIYSYRNGEKAVFINNQKIVLNDAQYKKLKEFAGK